MSKLGGGWVYVRYTVAEPGVGEFVDYDVDLHTDQYNCRFCFVKELRTNVLSPVSKAGLKKL